MSKTDELSNIENWCNEIEELLDKIKDAAYDLDTMYSEKDDELGEAMEKIEDKEEEIEDLNEKLKEANNE